MPPASKATGLVGSWLLLADCGGTDQPPAQVGVQSTSNQEISVSEPISLGILGDRNAPPSVPAVVHNGVRFEQNLDATESEFGQVGGIVSAFDATSNALLWSLVVYDNKRRPDLEGDVQDVYFTSMAFDAAGQLLIENERGERYAVDVEQRKVSQLP